MKDQFNNIRVDDEMSQTFISVLNSENATNAKLRHGFKFSFSGLVGWYSSSSSQIGFFITLYVFYLYPDFLKLNDSYKLSDYLTHIKNDKFDEMSSFSSIT